MPNVRPRWRTADAARAADVPLRHLSTLLDRQIFRLAEDDVASPGPGVSRLWTRESVFRLAVAVALARAGIATKLAVAIVDDFAVVGADEAFPTHLVADLGAGGRLVTIGDTAAIVLAVDLGPMLAAVDARLSELEPIQ